MRDGVKLHTVIVVPKGAHARADPADPHAVQRRASAPSAASARASPRRCRTATTQFVDGGYIRVFQDVRGKYGSEGDYVMTRPLRGPLNDTKVDHSTDAYDTIDWLVKNVPETNGKVGMIGSSYEGFTVLMALVDPHPALKAAVPMSPMVDGWKGDDWFHNGAFRQTNLDYIYGQTARSAARASTSPRGGYDDYDDFLRAGSAGDFAQRHRPRPAAVLRRSSPSIRPTTRSGRTRRSTRSSPPSRSTVPTMIVGGLWDQEDMLRRGRDLRGARAEGQASNNADSSCSARGGTAA